MNGSQNGVHPPYRIVLENALNVRDLGGYRTQNGRLTRRGAFFRADSLHRLSAADQELLLGLGVRTVIDLRSEHEIGKSPNVFASSPKVTYVNISLFSSPTRQNPVDLTAMIPTSLSSLYRGMLDGMGDRVKLIFDAITADNSTPLVFHCTAGKDRTGVISALLLALAGVEPMTIAEDYALTAEYILPIMPELRKHVPPMLTAEQYEPLLGAEPIYMLDTLEYLNTRYGGSEGYLRSIGLTDTQIKRLKANLIAEG